MKKTREELIREARTAAADVEAELADSDRCDDALAKHAGKARAAIDAEIKGRNPRTDDEENEYLYLCGQRRRARRVEDVAAMERRKR